MDMVQMGKALSTLGKTAGNGILEHAKQSGIIVKALNLRRCVRDANAERTSGRWRLRGY
jgi:hypothetical protein